MQIGRRNLGRWVLLGWLLAIGLPVLSQVGVRWWAPPDVPLEVCASTGVVRVAADGQSKTSNGSPCVWCAVHAPGAMGGASRSLAVVRATMPVFEAWVTRVVERLSRRAWFARAPPWRFV